MKCDHDCSRCEILCKDSIEAHNNALADYYMYKEKYEKTCKAHLEILEERERIKEDLNKSIKKNEELYREILDLKEENLRMRNWVNCKWACVKLDCPCGKWTGIKKTRF